MAHGQSDEGFGEGSTRAVYVISVAAELAGVHPQTLRIYERKGLLDPARTGGGNRRYSEADIAHLRRIQQLTAAGLNLEGVRRVMPLESEIVRLRAELERTPGGRPRGDRADPSPVPARPRAGVYEPAPGPPHDGQVADRSRPPRRRHEPTRETPSMTLDPNRWTLKTQEAVRDAIAPRQGAAQRGGRPRPSPVSGPVPGRRGRDPPPRRSGDRPVARSRNRIAESLAKVPKAYGISEPIAQPRACPRPSIAPRRARKEMGDEYLSVEHLLLALTDRLGVEPRRPAPGAAGGPRQPPRHLAEPRGAVPVAREVRPRPDRAAPGRASSTRSSGATTRSAASSRCSPGAPRTTRC